jgi:uncharacterized membrane protein YphA (DoxX/SURF4 family)
MGASDTPAPHSVQRALRAGAVQPWASTVVRLGLAAAFGWAGVVKIADPERAVIAVRAYHLVPEAMVRPIAWSLPFVELAVACLLLAGLRVRLAAALSLVLLVLFIVGMASAWSRGLRIDCGCFGGGGPDAGVTWKSYAVELARDALLGAAALALVLWPSSRFAVERSDAR